MKPKILVMEDDESIREKLVRLLEDAGHTVIQAKNGGDAVANVLPYCANEPLDLAFLDFETPYPKRSFSLSINGVQVAAHIKEKNSDTKVILYSGKKKEDIFERINVGEEEFSQVVDYYLKKPAQPNQILDAIAGLIGKGKGF